MKRAILLLAYLVFSSEPGSTEDMVYLTLKEGRRQLAAHSQRAADAFAENKCYRCGTCCKEKPCRFGEWDASHRQCVFLAVDEETPLYTTYLCQKHDDIVNAEKGSLLALFGGGCSNPMYNAARERIRRNLPAT